MLANLLDAMPPAKRFASKLAPTKRKALTSNQRRIHQPPFRRIGLRLDDRLAPLQQALARADVQAKLIEKGVDPQAAAARIANLSDAEIASIQQQIDQLPAGGDGLFAVLGIVFIVLLILDFVGATNVFRSV